MRFKLSEIEEELLKYREENDTLKLQLAKVSNDLLVDWLINCLF